MNVEPVLSHLERVSNLCKTLGMQFLSTSESDTVMAIMPVNERTCQPFGMLSGGASLALAESVAGVGSLVLCPNVVSMGISVSANHVKTAPDGEIVKATAHIVSQGHRLHVWHVDICDSKGSLISTVQVTNYISSMPLP